MRGDEATLSRLVVMAQRGDRQAYRTFLLECERLLKRYFARRVGPSQLDDLVQETLVALHQKLGTLDPSRAFLPWLAAVARYRWVDHLRRAYRRSEEEFDDAVLGYDDEPAISARISLERLFEALPAAQAKAIELVKIEGLSIGEAAMACGQSESLVKVNIHRGLKRLSALIEKA